MRVWIIHAGWDVIADQTQRVMRYGGLARALTERGHKVIQWTPTFNHFTKEQWYTKDSTVQVHPHHEIRFVFAKGYHSNVSLARLRFYQALARRLRRTAPSLPQPDIIVSGIPSVEWCHESVRYGCQRDIPVIIDVRDLWPDIFLTAVPHFIKPLAKIPLAPWFRKIRKACRDCTGICAVSQQYLDWGLSNARRRQLSSDTVFPLGYSVPEISRNEVDSSLSDFAAKGIRRDRVLCYFSGQFEKSYDLESVIRAANIVEEKLPNTVQFILCGDGSKMNALRSLAKGLDNVVFMGWCTAQELAVVGRISDIGLVAYGKHALQSLPNKPFEYMSEGNALVSSLTGELNHIIDKYSCGLTYIPGNVEQLANAIIHLASNPKTLNTIKQNALSYFTHHCQLSTISSQYAAFLEQVVESHKKN